MGMLGQQALSMLPKLGSQVLGQAIKDPSMASRAESDTYSSFNAGGGFNVNFAPLGTATGSSSGSASTAPGSMATGMSPTLSGSAGIPMNAMIMIAIGIVAVVLIARKG